MQLLSTLTFKFCEFFISISTCKYTFSQLNEHWNMIYRSRLTFCYVILPRNISHLDLTHGTHVHYHMDLTICQISIDSLFRNSSTEHENMTASAMHCLLYIHILYMELFTIIENTEPTYLHYPVSYCKLMSYSNLTA